MRSLFTIILFFNQCVKTSKKPMEFEHLYLNDSNEIIYNNDSSILYNIKVKSYTVSNYVESIETERLIDSFVCNTIDDSFKIYKTFFIEIYKKSEYTNNECYFKWKKDFQLKIIEDNLFVYQFENGNFWMKHKQMGDRSFAWATRYPCDKFNK